MLFRSKSSFVNVSLGTNPINTSKSGYEFLIDFHNRCSLYRDKKVLIDFSGLTWISGNMVALLQAIMYKLIVENKIEWYVEVEVINNKFPFLNSNGFIDPNNNALRSAVQLQSFNPEEDQRFFKYINEHLLGHDALDRVDSELKNNLILHFLEIFTNVEKHARTDYPLFACGQYFPLKKQLHFSLVDLGCGYLDAIRTYTHGKVDTAEKAIFWSLEEGNSTKADAPGGLGLKELRSFCDKNSCRFQIITDGAFWNNYSDKTRTASPFVGSQVNIVFDINKF